MHQRSEENGKVNPSELMVLIRHGADANYMIPYQWLPGNQFRVLMPLLERMLRSSRDYTDFICELIKDKHVEQENYSSIFRKTNAQIVFYYNPENWISYFIAIAQAANENIFCKAIENFFNIEMHEHVASFYVFSDTNEQNHEKILVQVFTRLNNLVDKPEFLVPIGEFIKRHSGDNSPLEECFKKLYNEHVDKDHNFVFETPTVFTKFSNFFGSSGDKKKIQPTETIEMKEKSGKEEEKLPGPKK